MGRSKKKQAEWLTTAEAAELVGCSRRTVYRMIDRGEITSRRFGGSGDARYVRVLRSDLEAKIVVTRAAEGAA